MPSYVIIFVVICIIHGLIHLMGFAKAFNLAEVQQLKHPISKKVGILWLVAALLFLASSFAIVIGHDSLIILMIPAVLLSQGLIFNDWKDAKFGTIPNVIIFAIVAFLLFFFTFLMPRHWHS